MYFLRAAAQSLTIESDMQIPGNCKKVTSYPEPFPKITIMNTCTIVFTRDSLSAWVLSVPEMWILNSNKFAPVENLCLLYKYCYINNIQVSTFLFIQSSIKSAITSSGWTVSSAKALLVTDFVKQCDFSGANKAEPPCVSLMYIYTLGNSLLFCHISFTPALVQLTLMMLKVRRMLLMNAVQRPGMDVTFIFQMTCINSVQSIHLDRLLCFQGCEIRLENSSTSGIDGIACLKLAIAAICLWAHWCDTWIHHIYTRMGEDVAVCWLLLKS